jgi:hypothetical protein
MRKETEYLKKESINVKLLRAELWFAPLLIIAPILVSLFLISDWFYRGFSRGVSTYDGELLLAIIILVGNILFDIPFIKSLITLSRK